MNKEQRPTNGDAFSPSRQQGVVVADGLSPLHSNANKLKPAPRKRPL